MRSIEQPPLPALSVRSSTSVSLAVTLAPMADSSAAWTRITGTSYYSVRIFETLHLEYVKFRMVCVNPSSISYVMNSYNMFRIAIHTICHKFAKHTKL